MRDARLPPHVEQTIESILEIHRQAEAEISSHQLLVERTTRVLGRPRTAYAICAFVLAWAVLNLTLGRHAFDAPPFSGLQSILSFFALLMAVLILTTQNRQGQMAKRRADLDLQLTALTEAKVAKVIELVEAIRADSPLLRERYDPEAAAMVEATNPKQVLEAIEQEDGAPDRG
jgi:uncharacterized membrane protein